MITTRDFKDQINLKKYQKPGQLILAITSHEDDEYFVEGESRLTTYGAHCEGLTHAPDGLHVLVWGGEYEEIGEYGEILGYIGNWWYVNDGYFETPANPVRFIPVDIEFSEKFKLQC